jgi:hypothetical protein
MITIQEVKTLVLKTESIVGALKALGVHGSVEVAETTVNELVEVNCNQIDTLSSEEDLRNEYDLLNLDVLDRILKESREAMIKIIDRAYSEAYYEPSSEDTKIVI